MAEEGREKESTATVQVFAAKKSCWTGGSYLYAGPGRKPKLLEQLESYLNRELQTINPSEPNHQELKLQVYRDVFGCFIKEFKTYQPLLSAIKKEYDNTLAYQQDQIRELEPMRSHLRLVTEECERKIQACLAEEQAEIQALKREKQLLQKDMEAMREGEKAMQAVVEHLQSELSNQYLQLREEHDARQLLICQLNDLRSCFVKEEHPVEENTGEVKNHMELQLALKVCQEDLAKAQEELRAIKAEYWDVIPRDNWDTLEQTHKQTLLQLKNVQGDFDQLKCEYDTLLKLHKRDGVQTETNHPITKQMDESVHNRQNEIQSNLLRVLINADATESGTLTVQEFREALNTAFPVKSDQAIDELATVAHRELGSSSETIAYQRLYSLGADGRNGEFLCLVKKQSMEERCLFVSQLKAQLGDKREVSVSDLRGALMCIDPTLDADTLDWNLSLAFQVKKDELKECITRLNTETTLQRLIVATVADTISSASTSPSKTDTAPSLQ